MDLFESAGAPAIRSARFAPKGEEPALVTSIQGQQPEPKEIHAKAGACQACLAALLDTSILISEASSFTFFFF